MDLGDICLGVALCTFALVALRIMRWCRRLTSATEKYTSAAEKLARWHEARPFLKVAACPYSRALVCAMIDAYGELLELQMVADFEHYERLKALLNEWPSPYSPATYSPATSGVISLRARMSRLFLKIPYTHEQ